MKRLILLKDVSDEPANAVHDIIDKDLGAPSRLTTWFLNPSNYSTRFVADAHAKRSKINEIEDSRIGPTILGTCCDYSAWTKSKEHNSC